MSSAPPLSSWQACRVSDVTPREVEWLWLNRLAFGKPALLEGDPDLKKSFLTLDLCARLSTGRPFPDGSPSPGPANTVILNGEDGLEDTIAVRLRALEADPTRIFVMRPSEENPAERFCLLAHLRSLDQILLQTDARLLIIDPVVSFVDEEINWQSERAVRRLLDPLGYVAERRHCAVVLVRHLTKRGGTNALYRGSGSIGIVASCRAAWVVGRDPSHAEQCVLAQVKNNLAGTQTSLVYRVDHAVGDKPTRFNWVGTSYLNADQLLASQRASLGALHRVRGFLRTMLMHGPRTAHDIWQSALEHEFSKSTLNRAKKLLRIKSIRVTRNHATNSYWLLPGQKLPPEIDPANDPNTLEPWLAPLRENYPEPTPLDDL